MDNKEFRKKHRKYTAIKFVLPEKALELNKELYESIFETLGSLEGNPDYSNLKDISKNRKKLGKELVVLCNEAEYIKEKIKLNNLEES